MSKLTNKAVMFAILIGSSTGHVFAGKGNALEKLESGLKKISISATHVVHAAQKDVPIAQAIGTHAITLAQATAAATGNIHLVAELSTAQTVLDGASKVAESTTTSAALKNAETVALTINSNAQADITKINNFASKADAVASIAIPLVQIAVAAAGQKTT